MTLQRVGRFFQPLAGHTNVDSQVRLQTTNTIGSAWLSGIMAANCVRGLIDDRGFMFPLPVSTDNS